MRKYVFPVLLAVFVLTVSGTLCVSAVSEYGFGGAAEKISDAVRKDSVDGWEKSVNDALDADHFFINLYGAVQRLLGKRLVDDPAGYPVAKLSNGQLTFAGNTELVDQPGNAENILRLQAELEKAGIPLLTVVAPTKLSGPGAVMPSGTEDYGNEMGDELLAKLSYSADTLDLRPGFAAADPENRWFFNTDHHWRAEGALFACRELMETLREKYGFAIDREALDPGSYETVVYPELFLGSQGKRVGVYYAGTDDFSVLTPKFETSFSYTYSGITQPRTGSFREALCFEEWLPRDYFNGNSYLYYSGGDWGRSETVNLLKPQGPTVVLIRDSFSCALAPFLANQTGRLITVDLRAYQGDLTGELVSLDPDLVMVLYSASSVKDPAMFDFFKS